jgi:antitoxin FitA-like protein
MGENPPRAGAERAVNSKTAWLILRRPRRNNPFVTRIGGVMIELVVGDIEADVIAQLEALAKQHGRSLNDEVLAILSDAVRDEEQSA